jgi:hypothetical protein
MPRKQTGIRGFYKNNKRILQSILIGLMFFFSGFITYFVLTLEPIVVKQYSTFSHTISDDFRLLVYDNSDVLQFNYSFDENPSGWHKTEFAMMYAISLNDTIFDDMYAVLTETTELGQLKTLDVLKEDLRDLGYTQATTDFYFGIYPNMFLIPSPIGLSISNLLGDQFSIAGLIGDQIGAYGSPINDSYVFRRSDPFWVENFAFGINITLDDASSLANYIPVTPIVSSENQPEEIVSIANFGDLRLLANSIITRDTRRNYVLEQMEIKITGTTAWARNVTYSIDGEIEYLTRRTSYSY